MAGQELGLCRVYTWLAQAGRSRSEMPLIREIWNISLLPLAQQGSNCNWKTQGWSKGDASVSPLDSGETEGQRKVAVYLHFSFHPLFASSPLLTAFRWLPVSRQMQRRGCGYWAHLCLFPLGRKVQRPLCWQHSFKKPKNKIPISSSPIYFNTISLLPHAFPRDHGFAKPL